MSKMSGIGPSQRSQPQLVSRPLVPRLKSGQKNNTLTLKRQKADFFSAKNTTLSSLASTVYR